MLHMLDHGDVDLIFVVDRHIYNKDYTVIVGSLVGIMLKKGLPEKISKALTAARVLLSRARSC